MESIVTLEEELAFFIKKIKKDPFAMLFVSRSIKENKMAILQIMHIDVSFVEYVPKKWRDDKEIMMLAIQKNIFMYQYCSEKLKSDIDINLCLVNQDGTKIHWIPSLFQNRKIKISSVQENGLSLQYFSDSFKNNRRMVCLAMKNNVRAIRFASENIRNDRKIIFKVIPIFFRLDAAAFLGTLIF